MKKIITLFSLLLLSYASFAQWNYTGNAFFGTVRGMYFLNTDTGFAVGSNGSISKTLDGGVNWDLQAPGNGLMRGVQFIDNDTGYVCGQYGQVFKTTNGGNSWSAVYNDGSTYFRAVEFVNASTGFLAGPSGKVYKSTNYGIAWVSTSLGISDADVIQIGMADELNGYLACANSGFEHGYIFKTTDGGETWQQIYSSDTLGMLALAVVDQDTMYAGGNLQTIIKTTDGGATWDTVYSGNVPEAVVRSAAVRSAASVVFADDFGNVLSTLDYGNSWSSELVGNSGLFSVCFPNAAKGYTGDLDGNIYSAVYTCVIPESPGAISGSQVVCSATAATYTINAVAGADSYIWLAPSGATIISGQGDTSVVIQFGTASGEVSVAGVSVNCGSGPATSLAVTVNSPPQAAAIAGAEAACENSQLSYSTAFIDGVNTYDWTVPEGATILSGQGDTSIVVLFGEQSGEISVTPAGNDCGAGIPSSISVTVTPLPQTAAINGSASVCEGSTGDYTTTEVPNADSYEWTVPSGASIISGQGTASIEVQFAATPGDVTVTAVSSTCGNGATVSFPVTINYLPLTPSPISGAVEFCSGDTAAFTINSVLYGETYNWNVPNNCVILSGQGDTSITVLMATGSGNITVYPSNTCGYGGETMLGIDVHPTPAPTITQSNDSLFSSSPAGNQWYYNGDLIPGATNQFYVATQNGTYHVVVTSGFGCSAASESLEVVGVGIAPLLSGSWLEIYPNPSAGNTYVQLSNLVQGKMVMVDQQGRTVAERVLDGDQIIMDVSIFAKGIYFIKLLWDDDVILEVKKLVVQ
jgi:photosystem II stability/assembly factor-like uncharacterized protein